MWSLCAAIPLLEEAKQTAHVAVRLFGRRPWRVGHLSVGLSVRFGDGQAKLYKEGGSSRWDVTNFSRIDRALINMPMAEALDFQCHFH